MNYIKIIPAVLLFTIVIGLSNSYAGGDKSKKLTEEQRLTLTRTYIDAARAKITNNFDEAIKKYNECLAIDPDNDGALYEIAQIYYSQNKISDAIPFAKKAAALNPKNEWYQLMLADIYGKNNQLADVVKVYKQLIKAHPENEEYYFQLANAYTVAKKPGDALKTYDKIEEMNGVSAEVSVEKERIYLTQNKVDKAITEIQKLIANFPNESRYYGMLAELYQANKQDDKAMELYNKIQKLDPDNSYVHLSLADYYRTKGDKEKSYSELKLAFQNKYLDIETKLRIMASYSIIAATNMEMRKQALELGKILIEVHPTDSRVFTIYGDMLNQSKEFKGARENYKIAIGLDKKAYNVWEQLIVMDYELHDFETLLKDCEEAESLFPTQPTIYFFKGVAKAQMDKNDEAIEIYKAGLNLLVDNKPLEEQFYANLGDAYFKLKNYKLSDESYDKALQIKPKDGYVLNNYSYYLSLRGERLEKAAEMSKLSNEVEPNSASKEDTYGWILYKQEKYNDAKTWIQKALQDGGNKDAVILEHLGDIDYKLGDVQGALENWQKAKTAEGKPSEFLDKKIADKKLYE